jgi:hypothetical protein
VPGYFLDGAQWDAGARDERNDYHGLSIERADRVVEALGE